MCNLIINNLKIHPIGMAKLKDSKLRMKFCIFLQSLEVILFLMWENLAGKDELLMRNLCKKCGFTKFHFHVIFQRKYFVFISQFSLEKFWQICMQVCLVKNILKQDWFRPAYGMLFNKFFKFYKFFKFLRFKKLIKFVRIFND